MCARFCVKMVIGNVIRIVSKGTQHGWSKLVGLVGGHVQEACAISEAAEGVSAGNENKTVSKD